MSKHWKKLAEDPKLWEKFHLPVDSRRTAKDVLEALSMPRFQQIEYIQFMDDESLGCDEVQFGIQTKIEVLEDVRLELMTRARKLIRTPVEKIQLHSQIKSNGIYNKIPPINPALDIP